MNADKNKGVVREEREGRKKGKTIIQAVSGLSDMRRRRINKAFDFIRVHLRLSVD